MSGRHWGCSNTYSHLNRPNNVFFRARTSSWTHCPTLTRTNSLKRTRTPSGSESNNSSTLESSPSSSSLRFPLKQICMGRPYNAKCVETSHLANRHKVTRKPVYHGSPQSLPCTDRPSGPCSLNFLDQLIKGINYLDRSTKSFYSNCPKTTLNLPKMAANYLEKAANSLHLDQLDYSSPNTYCNPRTIVATPDHSGTNNSSSMVPSTRGAGRLQYMGDATNMGYMQRFNSQNLTPTFLQRPGVKLPELPLVGNGVFPLGRLPKFWEAIHSSWSAPEPISKSSSWW